MIGKLLRHIRRIWRSAITGRFVSAADAKANPDTTTEERVK